MKRIQKLRTLVNMTFVIMLVAAIVFTIGFGAVIYIAREGIEKETDQKVQQSVNLIQTYVDGQLQRVEDVAYTLICNQFAETSRTESGDAHVVIDRSTLVIPTEEQTFRYLENFINANPHICGVAIGFEPFLYPSTKGKYGFAAYVTNVSGKNERLRLGEMHDFRQKEWYHGAVSSDAPYWSHPFTETSRGKVVACFSIPLHGIDNRIVGALALDIDTRAFHDKCNEVSPFPGAEVALVDSDFRFISHTNEGYIMKLISEVGQYNEYQSDDSLRIKMEKQQGGRYVVNKGMQNEALFYFAPIKRTGWTVSVECPKSEVYGGLDHMKKITAVISLISMLFLVLCFVLLFRRMQSETEKKAGIERDLQIASAIQMGMLPKLYPAFPERKDLDVYGFLKPAKTIGGDLYDYFIRDGKFIFCVGDVSGKGVPASLFMAVIRALFRNASLHTDDPAEILSSLNEGISDGNTHNMFCTMFLGVLDLGSGRLEYCNAGHNAPIIKRTGADGAIDIHFEELKTNIAIGVFEGFEYVKEGTVLNPGDALFLYTDGVTEAENTKKDLFGSEATLSALADARKHGARSAKEFVDYVYDAVKLYAGGSEQSDDITMLVVEYKGAPKTSGGKTLHLKNNIENVPSLGEWVDEIGKENGLAEDKIFQLNLALEEAVVNVMNYAYPDQEGMPVDVNLDASEDELVFTIEDHGIPFNPLEHTDPDVTLNAEERPVGGLGILLVRQLMEEVGYEFKDEHNILKLKMKK